MILVGSTGFVGSNLMKTTSFESVYHSSDIKNAYYTKPDVLIYAGVTGTKFWANKYPEKDYDVIIHAKENIRFIEPQKIILISSIDVNSSLECDERAYIKTNESFSIWGPYGNHRRELEKWVMNNYKDYHIIRLPAIYGSNLKKNYIYDLISIIPSILTKEKIRDLEKNIRYIYDAYILEGDEMYHLKKNYKDMNDLKEAFLYNKFNAISFTNPNSFYQYYNLAWLWEDIVRIVKNNIKVINLVTEPISSIEIFRNIYSCSYPEDRTNKIVNYNLKTIYSKLLGGCNGYIYSKQFVLTDLLKFINSKIKPITDIP